VIRAQLLAAFHDLGFHCSVPFFGSMASSTNAAGMRSSGICHGSGVVFLTERGASRSAPRSLQQAQQQVDGETASLNTCVFGATMRLIGGA